MPNTNYYSILGIEKNATQQEIKKAFRTKAKEFHPDRNSAPNAEDEFKKVNQAYEVLHDEQKRRTYDQFGAEAANQNHGFGGSQGFSGFSNFGSGYEDIFGQFNNQGGGFDDIFSSFFGGGSRKGSNSHNEDLNIHVEMEVSFINIVRGGKQVFSYKYQKSCETCLATGGNPAHGNAVAKCSQCNGAGRVIVAQKIPLFGTINSEVICPSCQGEGETILYKCTICGGKKYNVDKRKFEFDIIPGMSNGETLKVTGKGHERKGGKGDLYITIYVIPSQVFKRDSTHVYAVLYIDPMKAIAGGVVEIATPYGIEKISVPAGTENNEEIVIKGKGMRKSVGSNKIGDLILIVSYTKPYSYSKTQLEVLKKLIPRRNKPQEDYLKKALGEINENTDKGN